MNALLHDNLAGVRQIKSFVREHEQHARFNKVSDQLRRATLIVMRVWAIYTRQCICLARWRAAGARGPAVKAVLTGTMQIGDFVAFLMLIGFFTNPRPIASAQSTCASRTRRRRTGIRNSRRTRGAGICTAGR